MNKAGQYNVGYSFTCDAHMNIKIKIMLKGRKLSDTYLATIRRHRWSAQMMMKKDNLLELSASTVAKSSNLLSFFIIICALQRCL